MKRYLLLLGLLAVFVSGCAGSGGTDFSQLYVGGDEALSLEFLTNSPPSEVYDNNQEEFTVIVNVENQGEYDIQPGDGYVKLVGISPQEFGISDAQLQEDIPEIEGSRMNGNLVIEGFDDFVEFDGFSYQPDITTRFETTIRAEACYDYVTKATANICVKDENFDEEGDVCMINEPKTAYNSGGPIKVTSLSTTPGKDKIVVVFEVTHTGSVNDRFYKPGVECSNSPRTSSDENLVYVDVKSILNNAVAADCTGLRDASGSSGYVTLKNGQPGKFTCSFDTSSVSTDAVTPLNIELKYRYHEYIQMPLVVRDLDNQ